MLVNHVPVDLAFVRESSSAYFAGYFTQVYSTQGFFMQRRRFGQGGVGFGLSAA
jgi:hypothetical protein